MVGRNVDPIVRIVHDDRTVLVGGIRRRYPVGRVVDVHEYIVTEGRVAERRRARLDDHAVGVNIGRVLRQIDPVLQVRHRHRIDRRKPVHQAKLQLIAFLQRQPDAAVIGRGGRAGRALVDRNGRRPRADLIDPAGRIDGRTAGRHVGDARHRLRQDDDQKIEHAVRAREYRRLDEIGGEREVRAAQEGRDDGGRAQRRTTGVPKLQKVEWHGLAHEVLGGTAVRWRTKTKPPPSPGGITRRTGDML